MHHTYVYVFFRLDHAHLLPLLGYSSDGERLCLIYPYMSLGSLDRHIASHQFEANQRVAILRDIASALDYLHTGNETVLVHRDVKRLDNFIAMAYIVYCVHVLVQDTSCWYVLYYITYTMTN